MPAEPEALGLLALMLHCQARCDARYASDGEFVPLDQQDMARWSRSLIDEAEQHLRKASSFGSVGRFQLEAAIQSIHAGRAISDRTDWPEIALLYEGLVQIAPGIGSWVGRAVAMAQAGNPAAGLNALDAIPPAGVANYQPYWAARGHILNLLGRDDEARGCWSRAAGLTDEPALQRYLARRIAERTNRT
jgi:RNA polymerase sigma-70 factor (ECF subfamily)